MKPPFSYYGGKTKLVYWIRQFVPDRIDMYLEANLGSGALFFSAPRGRWAYAEVLNDINSDLINFFRVLRDNPDPLIYKLGLTPFSRQELRETDSILATCDDPVERARAFFTRAEQSFTRNQRAQNWAIPSARHNIGINWIAKTKRDRLLRIADRLRDANIENNDAIYTATLYDRPSTFIYFDPPYLEVSDKRVMNLAYKGNSIDHPKLIEFCLQAKSKIIVSGYENPIYQPLTDHGWRVEKIKHHTTAGNNRSSAGKYKTERIEVVWISPNCKSENAQIPLFDNF